MYTDHPISLLYIHQDRWCAYLSKPNKDHFPSFNPDHSFSWTTRDPEKDCDKLIFSYIVHYTRIPITQSVIGNARIITKTKQWNGIFAIVDDIYYTVRLINTTNNF